jgi:hypothetical protein
MRRESSLTFAAAGLGLELGLGLAMALPAQCQTLEDYQAACQDDALRLCSEHVSDHAKTKSCLQANKKSLSSACRGMLSPGKQKSRRPG